MSIPNSYYSCLDAICGKFDISNPKIYVTPLGDGLNGFYSKVEVSSFYKKKFDNNALFKNTNTEFLTAKSSTFNQIRT
jgi:hypothetical protein